MIIICIRKRSNNVRNGKTRKHIIEWSDENSGYADDKNKTVKMKSVKIITVIEIMLTIVVVAVMMVITNIN